MNIGYTPGGVSSKKITQWVLLGVLCLGWMITSAQQRSQTGMHFFSGSWKALLDTAHKQGKMIFVDVYTDWCGPCKYMDKFIFTKDSVGSVYNAHFVNYRLNAEKDEGIALSKKFGVNAYPTFLFLNSSGYLVAKAEGEREAAAFCNLVPEALKAVADTGNPGNLEQSFKEGRRDTGFLRHYLDKLTALNLDNSEVLDAWFKSMPAQELRRDTTLRFLAGRVTGRQSAALGYFMAHYNGWEAPAKTAYTDRLFEQLVRTGAGTALKEKRLLEYQALVRFGKQLAGLSEKQRAFLNRLDLLYGVETRNDSLIKKCGYAMAGQPYNVSLDSARREDRRRYQQVIGPYLSGEKDSTRVPGFAEEKKEVTNLYSRELADPLYNAAKAFTTLSSTEKKALTDALGWIKKCKELMPESTAFAGLQNKLEQKLKQ